MESFLEFFRVELPSPHWVFFFWWAGGNTRFWDEEFVKMGKKLCLAGNDPSFLLGFSSTRK